MKISDLIAMGLLSGGQELVWVRRRQKITHEASILSSGQIKTGDGKLHSSPSGAARHLNSNRPVDGWNTWKIKGTKTRLADIRSKASEN